MDKKEGRGFAPSSFFFRSLLSLLQCLLVFVAHLLSTFAWHFFVIFYTVRVVVAANDGCH